MLRIVSIKYVNFKSFKEFSISLGEFNILVGPNNAGKSTIIGSLKILAEGIRKARSRNPQIINDPDGYQTYGYEIDLDLVPVATENVFHNYDDSTPAKIKFRLSNNSYLVIFFPAPGICYMYFDSENLVVRSPKDFKSKVDIEIGFVPILGPVEHKEKLFQKEAARKALLSYTASRNFRNIWYHYRDDFEEFRDMIKSTWPGMDIDPPELDSALAEQPVLNMFCPEERIPREIFWAGFGFQVWCQMLTYIIKNKNVGLFLIDEPDIYLHSDLQRQLLGILKNLGPEIVIATHSTELVSEAEPHDIVVINKINSSGKRLKDPSQLREIFHTLGSNLNPTLTQIAKSSRVLFVEGKDFMILSKLARKLRLENVANRSDFAVVPIEGFNPTRFKAFKAGIEKTIGSTVLSAVIFDKDYRPPGEILDVQRELKSGNYFVHIHSAKEIENFILIPSAIKSAIEKRIKEIKEKGNKEIKFEEDINGLIMKLSEEYKFKTLAQLQSNILRYEKKSDHRQDDSSLIESFIPQFDKGWNDIDSRLKLIPGKEFLSHLNKYLQDTYKFGITYVNIIDNITKTDFPSEMDALLRLINEFRKCNAG